MTQHISPGSSKVCVRFKKLKTVQQLGLMEAHGKRAMGALNHVDASRSKFNRFYLGEATRDYGINAGNLTELWKSFVAEENLPLRRGRAVAAHVILIADPERLKDPATLEAWTTHSLQWAEATWQRQVIAARLDMDETSPHLDVFLVPHEMQSDKHGNEFKAISVASATRGKQLSYPALQSSYARCMEPLGFRRGSPRSETQASNIPVGRYRADIFHELARAKQLRIEAEASDERQRRRSAQLEAWSADFDNKKAILKRESEALKLRISDVEQQEVANAALAAQLQQREIAVQMAQNAATQFQSRLNDQIRDIEEREADLADAEDDRRQLEWTIETMSNQVQAHEEKISVASQLLQILGRGLDDNHAWEFKTLYDMVNQLEIPPETIDLIHAAKPELLDDLFESQQCLANLSESQRQQLAYLLNDLVSALKHDDDTRYEYKIHRRAAPA